MLYANFINRRRISSYIHLKLAHEKLRQRFVLISKNKANQSCWSAIVIDGHRLCVASHCRETNSRFVFVMSLLMSLTTHDMYDSQKRWLIWQINNVLFNKIHCLFSCSYTNILKLTKCVQFAQLYIASVVYAYTKTSCWQQGSRVPSWKIYW